MIDPAEVAAVRGRIPSLQHGRRFEIIEPIAEPAHLHAVRSAVMIRYALVCEQGHEFESWFQNSAAYDKQVEARARRPVRSAIRRKVEKAIMAPRLRQREQAQARRAPAEPPAPSTCGARTRLRAGRDDVAAGNANSAPSSRNCAIT